MKRNHTVIPVIAITLMVLAGCGGGAQDGRTTSQTPKKTNLPNDPCELVFHVISTMNKGPETFEAAILDVSDLRQLKKDFPDMEAYYDLWEEQNPHFRNLDFPLSSAFKMIFLERKAAAKNINFANLFDDFLKGYYSMFRDGTIQQQWIWDEIRLNDCRHRTSRYDLVSFFNEDGSHQEIDISLYTLPEIGQTQAFILINGEVAEWEFYTVNTQQGWRLFYPYLHWIRDEMEYEY